MRCIVSGIERRVSKGAVEKGVSKYGSITEFKKHYIDRAAKKLLRQRKQPNDVQEQLRPDDVPSFSIDIKVLAKLKLLKKPKNKPVTYDSVKYVPQAPKKFNTYSAYVQNITQGACMRPDIYLNNERCCTGCPFEEHCVCDIRAKSTKQKRRRS